VDISPTLTVRGCLMHWLLGVVRGHTVYQLHVTDAIVALVCSVLADERLRSFSGIPSVPSVGAEPAARGKPLCGSSPHCFKVLLSVSYV
jgi:hypothetical protein